jgi:hypothetical protein
MSALIDTYKNVRASTEANGLVKADWVWSGEVSLVLNVHRSLVGPRLFQPDAVTSKIHLLLQS